MRRRTAALVSVAWGAALGGAFGCLVPYLLHDWVFHRPLPYWAIAQAAGGLLIAAGLVPIAASFAEFIWADGTPVPVASPPRLVVSGCYRYVRNPMYVGFLAVLIGEALLFGSAGLLEYAAVAWCVGAAAVRWYEEPTLARRFGTDYQEYRRAVRAWIPRLRPWAPGAPAGPPPPQKDRATVASRELGGRHGLRRVEERDRRRLRRGPLAVLPFDLQVMTGVRERRRHPDVPDVAAKPR
jgi:protein-S-isoprenylcysteine O-methyltransferase Ste14